MADAEALPRPNWLLRLGQAHARALFFTLGSLARRPLGTLLTALVIGVTLALPAGFHSALRQLGALSYAWEGTRQASLFLKDSVSEARGRELAQDLRRREGVAGTRYLSKAQSASDFRSHSGFGEALDLLTDNPLPAVIVVTPAADRSADQIAAQLRALAKLPEVEVAKLDQEWLERLQAVLELARRAVLVIGGVLAAAMIAVVGNTVRLDLQARRDEIVVMKLLGASASFIRRPFLYAGLWYGLAGGLVAWSLLLITRLLLAGPTERLLALYGSGFGGWSLSETETAALFAAGLLLGLGGAWLSVSRHLSDIEPETR